MSWIVIIITCLTVCFGFVILFGAPYLPTKKAQIQAAFELLDLESGQSLIELGCGDGRVLRSAAERGLFVTGYELNPLLVLIARIVNYRYRNLVTVVWGNYWHREWPEADAIYCFLLDKYMSRLDKVVSKKVKKPIKLASFAFKIPNKKPTNTRQGVFLYHYN